MTDDSKQIAELKAKVNALERQLPPTMPSEKEIAVARHHYGGELRQTRNEQ